MKKNLVYSLKPSCFNILFLFVAIFFSCEREDISSSLSSIDDSELKVEYDYKSELKRDFAKALVQALKDNIEIRKLIKGEALKMFDKDYDVLYQLVKNKKMSNNRSFRDILEGYFKDKNRLAEIENNLPLLTIFVPELPEGSFSANTWDIQNEIPEVAIRMTTTNHVPMFTSDNKEYILKGRYIPSFPVVVIKDNERIIVNNLDLKLNKSVKGSILKTSDNSYEFKFLDDVFNNSLEFNSTNKKSSKLLSRVANNIDPKLIDAYNIYKNADGWQRDYIYYNLTPSNTKDQFQYDFQEHITQFSLRGDATAAYNKISDQTGDPEYRYIKKAWESNWTGGAFEFKVRVLINGRNGIGEELITYFPANPDQLFDLTYKNIALNVYFEMVSISLKSMPLDLSLFNWDLNQYASSIKIEIEEVDLTTTTVLTDTRSVKFANNFSIDPTDGIFKKIGLKFGSSLETNTTQTIQKTFTQGNDQLGEVIINFADDVILTHVSPISTTREYQTGWYSISVEPARVQ